MNKPINEVEFVIFDVETTGLSPNAGDRICELAAIRVKNKNEIARFHSLINPGFPMPLPAYEIHHISDGMLSDAAQAKDVLPSFLEFIRESVLTGYNVGFDLGFLENELKLIDKKLQPNIPSVDILKMARRLYTDKQSYSLSNFSKEIGLNVPQIHRAMQDVELTKEVFDNLLIKMEYQSIKDFTTMHNLFGLNLELINQENNLKIAEIIRAIDLKAKIKIKYFTSSSGETSEREVSPLEIRQDKNKYYLIGFCHMRKEERTFSISNIISLQL